MKTIKHLLILLSLIFLGIQCANPEKKSEETANQTNGQIDVGNKTNAVVAVAENHDSAEKTKGTFTNPVETEPTKNEPFITYIPKNAAPAKGLPAVFIFDPHARGYLPVEMYKNLADEFGFVLIGSNRSQNGQPIQSGKEVYEEMRKGLENQVNIDPQQIYTLGFSGGARVAVYVAIQEPNINAVVGCGAGFPGVSKVPEVNFYYFALVGYEDFNMNELINNNRYLSRSGLKNELAIFDGGHDWPPEEVMREAFLAIQVNNIRKGITKNNTDLIKKADGFYNEKIKNYIENDRYFDAAETAQRAASVLKDVEDVSGFEKQRKEYIANPGYKNDLSKMVNTMEKENGIQNTMVAAFTDKDLDWWKVQINEIRTPSDDLFVERMNKRLAGFLGLISYIHANKSIESNDLVQAQKNLKIYEMIEPLNPEHGYLNAVVKMKLNDEKAAIEYLKQSMFLGLGDPQRLMNEPAFGPLKDNPDFMALMQ